MKKLLIFSVLICYFGLQISPAQSQRALARLDRDAQLAMKYREFPTAIEIYDQLLKIQPDELRYNYEIGVCHLNTDEKVKSLQYFNKVHKQNAQYNTDLKFMLGQANHYTGDFESAKSYYEEALKVYTNYQGTINSNSDLKTKEKEKETARTAQMMETCKKRIKECEYGIELRDQPINAGIANLGPTVNSEFPEYTPLLPRDTSFMIYTSRRNITTGGRRDISDDLFFEDIYVTMRKGDDWSSPQSLGINRKYHDAAAAIDPDGQVMYVYRDNRRSKGDLYVSNYNKEDQSWEKPKKLNSNINTKYQESSLTISPDGNTLYFTSDRPGGKGGLDIYMCKKESNGDWGEAVNLGDPINTPYDDDAPFITFDGKSLYFSSTGHNTMGGYDIFKSESLGNDKWGEPENLGFPINGPDNDFHLVLTLDNRKAYYVSNDDSGYGRDDIYTLTAPRVQLNKLDKDGIELTTPDALIALNNPEKIDNQGIPKPNFNTIVNFGFDLSGVTKNNQDRISQWIEYLKANESVRVEISGHTCNIGNFQYNQILSQRRARAVANYLIKQGIDANRIEVQGYSFSRPLPGNSNRTPAERAANRRTEFTIIEENKNE